MESEAVNKGEKETLRQRKTQLDPFELKAGLEDKLKEFFRNCTTSQNTGGRLI